MASEASLIGQMTSNTFGDSSVSAFDFFGISRPHRWSETLMVFAFPSFMFIFTERPTNLELCGGKSESVHHPENTTECNEATAHGDERLLAITGSFCLN